MLSLPKFKDTSLVKFFTAFFTLFFVLYFVIDYGSANYIVLGNGSRLNTSSDCVIMILASWCGHCEKLKRSGEIEKLSKNIKVIIIPETHKEADHYMKKVQSRGFPTIICNKNGRLHKYNGERTADGIMHSFKSL